MCVHVNVISYERLVFDDTKGVGLDYNIDSCNDVSGMWRLNHDLRAVSDLTSRTNLENQDKENYSFD